MLWCLGDFLRGGFPIKPYLGLFLGVAIVSFAAILIRLAEAPPLVIAAYRMGIASLIVVPLSARRLHRYPPKRREGGLALLSGGFLALHFAFWITSLNYTSVASSVILVTTTPLFAGAASHFLTGDKLRRQTFLGILISLGGGIIIGSQDLALGWRPFSGDALALLGAMAAAGYFVVGRKVRMRLPLISYLPLAYGAAALALLFTTLVARHRLTGYSGQTYLMLLLLALGPQLIGHSTFNWALRYLSATAVTVAILGEPVGASLLAYLILGEAPSAWTMGGGGLMLLGIYMGIRGEAAARAV